MRTDVAGFMLPPAGTVNLSATTASSRVAFISTSGYAGSMYVQNFGSVTVFVETGSSTVTAAVATGFPIPAGGGRLIRARNNDTHLAAITATGSATVYITPGRGDIVATDRDVTSSGGASITDEAPLLTTDLTQAAISFSSSGDNTVVSATASQVTRVYRLLLNANATTTLTFKDGAATSLSGAMAFDFRLPLVLPYSQRAYYTTTANTAFIINSTDAVQVSGTIWYIKS